MHEAVKESGYQQLQAVHHILNRPNHPSDIPHIVEHLI